LVFTRFGRKIMIGRAILLLLLIAILALGGVIWFDYLNVIDAKTVLAPFYKYLPAGIAPGAGRTQPVLGEGESISLDAERIAVVMEAYELRHMELDTRQRDLDTKYGEIEQMAQELEERQKALDEREKSLRAQAADAENKDRNVEANSRILTGMPPQAAVSILAGYDDQDAIDVLRKTEEIAQAEGTASIVPYWFSLMDSKRAAELQRKMAGRPPNL
jgi:flagellar protein FlbB